MIYEIEYTIFLKDDVEFRDMLLKLSKKMNSLLLFAILQVELS